MRLIVAARREAEAQHLIADRQGRIEPDRLARFAQSGLHVGLRGAAAHLLHHIDDIGHAEISARRRVAGIQLQRPLIERARGKQRLAVVRTVLVAVARLKHEVVGLQVLGRPLGGLGHFRLANIGNQMRDDLGGQIGLDRKDILDAPVIAARPQMRAAA